MKREVRARRCRGERAARASRPPLARLARKLAELEARGCREGPDESAACWRQPCGNRRGRSSAAASQQHRAAPGLPVYCAHERPQVQAERISGLRFIVARLLASAAATGRPARRGRPGGARDPRDAPRGRGLGAPTASAFRCASCGEQQSLAAAAGLAARCTAADPICTPAPTARISIPARAAQCRQPQVTLVMRKSTANECVQFEPRERQEFAAEKAGAGRARIPAPHSTPSSSSSPQHAGRSRSTLRSTSDVRHLDPPRQGRRRPRTQLRVAIVARRQIAAILSASCSVRRSVAQRGLDVAAAARRTGR